MNEFGWHIVAALLGYALGCAFARFGKRKSTEPCRESFDYEKFKADKHAELRESPWYALGWMWANREDIPLVCYSQAAFQLGALDYQDYVSKPLVPR